MLIQGDARHLPLQAQSVHCVVTSPPYWGLRDYKVEGQLGLEPMPELYVAHMVEVFHEVRRVLRDDGTLWLNLGDSYAQANARGATSNGTHAVGGTKGFRNSSRYAESATISAAQCGLKPKDLVGIPWRVAFALQADGWYLRSDIIWSKPNPMPESVTDRPTKAHEYLFLLAKSERYYYDADSIREAWTCDRDDMRTKGLRTGLGYLGGAFDNSVPDAEFGDGKRVNGTTPTGRNRRSVWTIATQPYPEAHFATFPEDLVKPCVLAGAPPGGRVLDPFAGTGTVVRVAEDLGRRGVGVELAHHYIPLARTRTAQMGLV